MACQAQTTPAFSGAGTGSARDGPRRSLRGQRFLLGTAAALFLVALFPAALDAPRLKLPPRRLANSLNFGGGDCQWKPPTYTVPDELEFHKTLVTGFPSGDKRIVFLQMEGLTGWPAKDEWDFAFLGMSNHPFIKANYPHHEGIWGWEQEADQVVLVVPYIRRAMVEYHDIVWDLDYATTWEEATIATEQLFKGKPHLDEFYAWRDARAMDEARWYGWFIDYWMEGGLQRDIFTHNMINHENWMNLMNRPFFTREELRLEEDDFVTEPSYDPHCAHGDISGGCVPVAVVSADWLRDDDVGPAETTAIGTALLNDARTGQYLIGGEAWACIWEELIVNRKGPKTAFDRPGVNDHGYNFSLEMLGEMLFELNRLIDKYSQPEWNVKNIARRLVDILVEHRSLLQTEINELNSGMRMLRDRDFLGPAERDRRKISHGGANVSSVSDDDASYFRHLEQTRFQDKIDEMKRFVSTREEKADSNQNMSDEERKRASAALERIRSWEEARRPNSNHMAVG